MKGSAFGISTQHAFIDSAKAITVCDQIVGQQSIMGQSL